MPVTTSGGKVKVMILEDEALYRDLLRTALMQHGRFEVVGAFADGEAALEAAPRLRPDVAIHDIELGRPMNGIQVGILLRRQMPGLGIVLLSNHDDPHFIDSIPRDVIGGWSYLLKKTVSDVASLARAIEGAVSGFVVVDPQILRGLRPREQGLLAKLTPRQTEILSLIAQGFSNAAIAQQLVLSEKSVENQINVIYQQLDLRRTNSSVQPRVMAVLTYLRESQPARVRGVPPV